MVDFEITAPEYTNHLRWNTNWISTWRFHLFCCCYL